MRVIYILIIIFLMNSCFVRKENGINNEPISFRLIILEEVMEEETSLYKRCHLSYEIKNNTEVAIYFNKMNFSRNITDTSGTFYKEGYFKILQGVERDKNGAEYCMIGLDYDIYPMNKKDTLNNIIKILAKSFYRDTLRAYGYYYVYNFTDKKDNLPFCFKKEVTNKNKIKFQLLYDNLQQDVRADTIWKGKLLSNVAVWK